LLGNRLLLRGLLGNFWLLNALRFYFFFLSLFLHLCLWLLFSVYGFRLFFFDFWCQLLSLWFWCL
jgi:hypothetical protein